MNDSQKSEETSLESPSLIAQEVDDMVAVMDNFSLRIEGVMSRGGYGASSSHCKVKSASLGERLDAILSSDPYKALHSYQVYGVKWILTLHLNGLNGILADEMGLGKTISVIKFFEALGTVAKLRGPHLMVGPLSVLSNWYKEIERFSPEKFDVYVHYGDKAERDERFKDRFRKWRNESRTTTSTKIKIVLTTYALAIIDGPLLNQVVRNLGRPLEYLVIDEAHRIKNKSSVLYRTLSVLPHRHRLLLTGTPLQNNLNELWTLLRFVVPSLFPQKEEIHDWFNQPFIIQTPDDWTDPFPDESSTTTPSVSSESSLSSLPSSVPSSSTPVDRTTSLGKLFKARVSNLRGTSLLPSGERRRIIQSLHRVLKPFLLRRCKTDVLKTLPRRVNKVIHCPLTPLQHQLTTLLRSYALSQHLSASHHGAPPAGSTPLSRSIQRLLQDSVHDDRVGTGETEFSVYKAMMMARKLCNHPFLVMEDTLVPIPDDIYFEELLGVSGKLQVLHQLLSHLLSEERKVLIFSQFTTTLDLLQSYFGLNGWPCFRIDGSTAQAERQQQIEAFNQSTCDTQLFLLTTPAGGLGVNLQGADTVVIFDQDWNPQVDLQAIARAHRMGQSKTVLVLRLMSAGLDKDSISIEDRIFSRAMQKLRANNEILHFSEVVSDAVQSADEVNVEEEAITEISSEEEGYFDVWEDSTPSPPKESSSKRKKERKNCGTAGDADDVECGSGVRELGISWKSLFIENALSEDLSRAGDSHPCLLHQKQLPLTSESVKVICERLSVASPHEEDYEEINLHFDTSDGAVQSFDNDNILEQWRPWLSQLKRRFGLQDRTTSAKETDQSGRRARSRRSALALDQLDLETSDNRTPVRGSQRRQRNDDDEFNEPVEESPPKRRKRGGKVSAIVDHAMMEEQIHQDRQPLDDDEPCVLCGYVSLPREIIHSLLHQNFESLEPYLQLAPPDNADNDNDNALRMEEAMLQLGGYGYVDTQVLCDGCEGGFHLLCLGRALAPDEDPWYCSLCKTAEES